MVETSVIVGTEDHKLQKKLLKAFRRRNLEEFASMITNDVNLEYKYNQEQLTLLMMACIRPVSEEYVRILLENGADPNTGDPDNRTALHYAAFQSSDAALELLLADKRTNVNAVDKEGSTALHYTTAPSWTIRNIEKHLRCITLIMDHPHFEVNRPDIIGQTAITTAVLLHYNDRIKVMLQHGGGKLDIDSSRVSNGRSVREMIKTRFPELKRFLPPQRLERINSPDRHLQVLSALQHRDLHLFKLLLNGDVSVNPNHWFDDPYYSTFLELACRMKGSEQFVKALIEAGADPNTTNRIYGLPVIHQATESGNDAVLEVLLKIGQAKVDVMDPSRHTALHVAAQKQCSDFEEAERMQRCISLLLDHDEVSVESSGLTLWYEAVDALSRPGIDINAQDEFGDTALHDAAHYGNKGVVLTLLRRGANIMKKNQEGDPPLAFIDAVTLDMFLDEQLTSNGLSPLSDDYQLIMKYTYLDPPTSDENDMSEMEALYYISRSEDLRHLLRHPVINSFLYLKWEMVSSFFYVNLVLYILFVTMLTAYILLINVKDDEYISCTDANQTKVSNLSEKMIDLVDLEKSTLHISIECTELDENCKSAYTKDTTLTDFSKAQVDGLIRTILKRDKNKCVVKVADEDEQTREEYAAHCLRYPLFYIIIIIFLREILQFVTSPIAYLKSCENYLDLFLIIVSTVALSSDWEDSEMKQHISAIAILLSWLELVFITGRLPLLSTQLEMLKKVSITFLRFMAWYSLLIVGFALTFYTLFRRNNESGRDATDTFFLDPWLSMMKTVIMMVGEFEASELVFEIVPITSHIVFTLFVFLIAIILLNLLNGLAVSDTQAIKDDALVLSLVSMVKLVSYLENLLIRISIASGFLYKGYYKKFLSPRMRLFNINLPNKQVHTFPSTGKVKFLLDVETTEKFKRYKMDKGILKSATDIVTQKREVSQIKEAKKRLAQYEYKFQEMDKCQKKTQELVNELLMTTKALKDALKDHNM